MFTTPACELVVRYGYFDCQEVKYTLVAFADIRTGWD